MEYEFRIRKTITGGFETEASDADGYGIKSGSHRANHGQQLEDSDQFPGDPNRNAYTHPEQVGYTDHQRRTGGLYGAADRAPAAARRGNGSDYGSLSEKDDALSGQLGEGMSVGSEEPGETGWEREREIFASTLRADHAHEEAEQALLPDRYDPRSYPASLGTGAAYLAADLWELMDEDAPMEDCTTMPQHPDRKKHQGPVMGGM